ncbi:hypothetical protein SpCBS45565_g03238 [Spizellomyces sp. 'palustris']|nr:hypothetical protein SpCBS45565_g03238 [Spizellomyces sp. 'palustris']
MSTRMPPAPYGGSWAAVYCEINKNLHRGFGRALTRMQRAAPTVSEADTLAFLNYMSVFLEVLHQHHEHEEQISYPVFVKYFGERELKELEAEHGNFQPAMRALEDYISDLRVKKASFNGEQIAYLVKNLETVMMPHLNHEESYLCTTALNEKIPQDEMYHTFKNIESVSKKDANPTTHLSFLLTHLTTEEQNQMFYDAPAIVRKILFRIIVWWNRSWWKWSDSA